MHTPLIRRIPLAIVLFVTGVATVHADDAVVGTGVSTCDEAALDVALGQLYPDFLKSPAVLSCPMAVPNASGSEYEYTRPPAAAPGTFVAIRCRRHRFRTIRVVLEGRLDGSVASRQNGVARVISPAERSIMKRPAEPEAGK